VDVKERAICCFSSAVCSGSLSETALAKSFRWTCVGRLFHRVITAAPRHCRMCSSSWIRATCFFQSGSRLPPSYSHLARARTSELSFVGTFGSLPIMCHRQRYPMPMANHVEAPVAGRSSAAHQPRRGQARRGRQPLHRHQSKRPARGAIRKTLLCQVTSREADP